LREATITFFMSLSICSSAWNNSAPTGQIFIKFDIWVFIENVSRIFKINVNRREQCLLLVKIYIQGGSNMTGTNCDLFTHNQSRSYLNHLVHLWKYLAEFFLELNQNTLFIFNNFFPKIVPFARLFEKKYDRDEEATDSITRRMRLACWITTTTNTRSQYVILLFLDDSFYTNKPQCYIISTFPLLLIYGLFSDTFSRSCYMFTMLSGRINNLKKHDSYVCFT
jgi:hypothetical protein